MGAHMQQNSGRHPFMHVYSREFEPAARPRKSHGNAFDNSSLSIVAKQKDSCGSAESSTCLSCNSLRKLGEPNNYSAIKQRTILDSYCGKVSANGKRKPLIEYHHCAVVDDSLRCHSAEVGDCNSSRPHCRVGSDEEVKSVSKVSKAAHELLITSKDSMQRIDLVCCMCGDAGIADLLFLCSKCGYRHQHTYCSRSYPEMYDETSICNWCLHKEKAAVLRCSAEARDHSSFTSEVVGASTRPTNANPGTVLHDGPTESKMSKKISRDSGKMVTPLSTAHSKAFEYLLLAAAQSLCEVDRSTSGTTVEIKHEIRITSSIDSNRGSAHRDPEIGTVCETPLANLSNLGLQNVERKSNQINTHTHGTSSMIGVGTDLHSQVKISRDHRNIDIGRLVGGSIPKRPRGNKGINSPLKCRKKGLHLSPSKPMTPRYKLLADVVC